MSGDESQDKWKYKYLDALDEFEAQEKSWADAEQILRRGMSRLALISQGSDSTLDNRLSSLRKLLQKTDNIDRIGALMNEVSERVKVLDLGDGGDVPCPEDMLEKILSALSFPSALSGQADKIKHQLSQFNRNVDDDSQLFIFVDDIAALLGQCMAGTISATEGESALLEAVFVDFLESLSFPAKFSERVQTLKENVADGVAADTVKPLTHQLITLVVEMRSELEHEKEELELFLHHLTQRLHDLDVMVEGAEFGNEASLKTGRQLGDAMNAEVNDIENIVNSSTETAQMKIEIQSSLESIRKHLAVQRSEEETHQHELKKQLKTLAGRLQEMEQESTQLKQRLTLERAQALTDPLTGAANRLAFDQRMVQEFSRWQRHKPSLSLVLLDVDLFKNINDTYGHKAGDRALKVIVQSLQKHTRENDFLARVGGEEFVIILPDTNLEGAVRVAEKLRLGIASSAFVFKEQPVPITVSGGIAEFTKGDTIDGVYMRADEALYRAKRGGRNQFKKEK